VSHFDVGIETQDVAGSPTPKLRRVAVRWKDRPILDLTQGTFRNYIFPLYSPAGVPLTAEYPSDHPHHNSVVVSADAVVVKLPPQIRTLSNEIEEATYNLYVNEIFQGRAPGRIWATAVEAEERGPDHLTLVQSLQWQGPVEWGAPSDIGRRVIAEETRTIDIRVGDVCNVVDVRSQLRPTRWDLTIGPARHAYFTVRVEDSLRPDGGATMLDSRGRVGADSISGSTADWVDISGEVAHGRTAGLTVMLHSSLYGAPLYCAGYGTITINPFMRARGVLDRGQELDLAIRLLAHDGTPEDADVAAAFATYRRENPLPPEGED